MFFSILYQGNWTCRGNKIILLVPFITKTCLYNVDPLKPYFYIVKLGFTGYTVLFLFLLRQCMAALTSTHNLCFEHKYEKYPKFYLKNFIFLVVQFLVYFNRLVFIMRLPSRYGKGHMCCFLFRQMWKQKKSFF